MRRIQYAPSTTVLLPNIFGTGADGNVTVSTSITLAQDMNYNNLTVTAAGTINTAGFRIFVKGTLRNLGTIHCNGNNASGTSQGAFSGGATTPKGYSGGAGVAAVGNGNSSTYTNNNLELGFFDGGAGGGGSGGNAGNGGQGSNGSGTTRTTMQNIVNAISGTFLNDGVLVGIGAGGGGGGGGMMTGASGTTGAGGGGAGTVFIAARTMNGVGGTLSAVGGNGSAATGSGNVGGGGGGGGGLIIVVAIYASLGTTIVTGGTAGGKLGTASTASAGSPGLVLTIPGV